MDRLFRIDFYPQDWIIDTSRLNPEQRGIYIQIISLMYANRGAIDNNPTWIAGVSGCSSRLISKVVSELVSLGFIELSGSKITQKRVEDELNKKREHLETSSKGGRKSAEKRSIDNENNHLDSSEQDASLPTSKEIAKASPKAKANNNPYNPPLFGDFWEAYPRQRRSNRSKTESAYVKALEKATAEEIMAGLLAYAQSEEVANGFGKAPAAWLNDERWMIDYTPPKAKSGGADYFEQNMAAAARAVK